MENEIIVFGGMHGSGKFISGLRKASKDTPKKDRRAYMWKYRNKNRDVPEHFGKSSDHNPRS